MRLDVSKKFLIMSLIIVQNGYASDPSRDLKTEQRLGRAHVEFRDKLREQMVAICSNPNLKALQADKEKMMKTIIGNLFATPVAPECSQVNCDSTLFSERLVDCNKVFACSNDAKELTCMTSNKERLDFSLKKIDAKTYEDFAQFYLEKNSKYPTYLAKKNPALFKCDVTQLKISDSKTIKQPELSESDFKSFEDADRVLAELPESDKYKTELESITNEHDFKKFLLGNFYSIESKNERRFLGYMLKRRESTFENFKLSDYVVNGKIDLPKVQNILEQRFANFHCGVREQLADRLSAAQSGIFPPITMKDQELIGEIMRFKNIRQSDATKSNDFNGQIATMTQACLLESAALESFINTDRSVEAPSQNRNVNQLSSHAFAEMLGIDPLDANGQKNESLVYTESSASQSSGNYAVSSDEVDRSQIQTSSIKDLPSIEKSGNSIESIARSMNDFQYPMGQNSQQQSFNHIFDSNYNAGIFNKDALKEESSSDDSSSKNPIFRPFEDLSREELTKLKEQTTKELSEKLAEESAAEKSVSPSAEATTTESAETALLKKRLAELEKRLQEKSDFDQKAETKTNFFAKNRNNLERRNRENFEKESRHQPTKNTESFASRAPASDSNIQSTSSVQSSTSANLKLVATKNNSNSASSQTEGEKTLIAANINPIMLDYIYQKISDNKEETFLLETTPGSFMEVIVKRDQDGKMLFDKNGKPVFDLKPAKDKSKFTNRKISSLPQDPAQIKRDLKETKSLESVTRQMELNKVLKGQHKGP